MKMYNKIYIFLDFIKKKKRAFLVCFWKTGKACVSDTGHEATWPVVVGTFQLKNDKHPT